VKVCERKAAPWCAQNAEPGDAIVRIEKRADESESVNDFRAVLELFELDGAEGNCRLAQRARYGHQGFVGAGEDSDAKLLPLIAESIVRVFCGGLVDGRKMAADKGDDFVDLFLTGGLTLGSDCNASLWSRR